jgi:hypothetical protein
MSVDYSSFALSIEMMSRDLRKDLNPAGVLSRLKCDRNHNLLLTLSPALGNDP